MKEQLERIVELPVQYKLLLAGGVIGLILGFYWLNFYSGVAEEISVYKKKIDGKLGLKVKIAEQQAIAQNLDEFIAQVEKLDIELNKALAELPDKREIHQLLSRISDKARDSGLEIHLFKPQHEEKKDFYAKVPVQIEVQGTYHEVGTFFDEVGHLARIVNLDSFQMVEPEISDKQVDLKTAVVATAFRFLDESERPSTKDEEGKGKRRRGRKKKRGRG